MKTSSLVCILLLPFCMQLSHAAIVVNDMIAFFQTSCPSGWSDIDSSKRGYLLVVDPNGGTTAGTIVGSALSNQQNPQHTHSVTAGTFCINTAISAALVIDGCTSGCLYKSLKPLSSYTICEDSAFSLGNSVSGYPFVQLRLCKATSLAQQVEVPANTVAYFDSSVQSCPAASGWSDYTAAHGRVLVPQTKNTSPQTSSSSALTSGQTLSHKHSISTTVTNLLQSNNDVYNAGDKSTIGNLNGATTRTVDVQTSNLGSTDLGIGYVQLTACVAGPTSAPTYIPPPSGAMLFTSTSSCSSDGNWNAVEDAFLNRLVVGLPNDAEANNGATWGGSAIVPPNDVTHTHSVPATTLDFSASDWQSNSASNVGGGKQLMNPTPTPTPTSVSVPTFTSATNTGGSIPYLALGLCRSSGPVTSQPTTKTPTKNPTATPSTVSPSKNPVKNPTVTPTNKPTVSPTKAPTTRTPTKSPSKNPTKTPTTATPTKSPTRSPTPPTRNPTMTPSKQPTKNPTLPTLSPTYQPSKRPTRNPTNPTKQPSKSPTVTPTLKPSRSPIIGTLSPTNPTRSPTPSPSNTPSESPTPGPTSNPTVRPTPPTESPTTPSESPTRRPSYSPTNRPTQRPTNVPTRSPTKVPTLKPTLLPSRTPSTAAPTFKCSPTDKFNWESNGGQDNVLSDLDICSKATTCSNLLLQTGKEKDAADCVEKCLTTNADVKSKSYTDTCTSCIAEFSVCQYTQCGDCKKGRTKNTCRECTNKSTCIAAFRTCSGSMDMVINLVSETPAPSAADSTAVIAGSIGGVIGFIGLSAVLFCYRQSNKQRKEHEKLLKETQVATSSHQPFFAVPNYIAMENPAYSHKSINPGMLNPNAFNGNFMAGPMMVHGQQQANETWENKGGVTLIVLHSFAAENATELTVEEGQEVQGMATNGTWYMVKNPVSNQIGLVPSSYLQEV